MSWLNFDSCVGNRLELAFPHDIDIKGILTTFEALRIPGTANTDERIVFALIELISNSLRAQKERAAADPVLVEIGVDGSRLMADVSDHGGGFDPDKLPFSLDVPVEGIDLMAEPFAQYRLRHGLARFGMGLVFARRVFSDFSLEFVDGSGNRRAWPSAEIVGTRIRLGMALNGTMSIPPAGEHRSEKRDRCFAKVALESSRSLGHVTDISDTGLKVLLMPIPTESVSEEQLISLSPSELGIPPFRVRAKTAWRLDGEESTVLGMRLLGFPDESAKAGFEALRLHYR
jgi:anti-sigma regulatory factor (Ser/Thr protein kinase)